MSRRMASVGLTPIATSTTSGSPTAPTVALDLARADGVDTFIVVGCDRATTLSALEVAAANRDVWATVGLHPHEASHGVDTVVDLLDSPGVAAVGEAGLDFHYDHSPAISKPRCSAPKSSGRTSARSRW